MESSTLNDVISSSRYKEYARNCEAKSLLYGAMANLYMGMQSDEEKKFGFRSLPSSHPLSFPSGLATTLRLLTR